MASEMVSVDSVSRTGILTEATDVAANTSRKGFLIQNLGQNALFVKLGSGATTSSFDVVLKAGTANDDGTAGSYEQTQGVIYRGLISFAGTTPRYTVTQFPG